MSKKEAVDGFGYVQKIPFKEDTMMFQLPFAMCIAGPTQSGKSEFIFKLLQNKELLFPTHFHRLIYCIPNTLMHENSFIERLRCVVPHVELCHGIPNISKLQLDLDRLPSLLIMDDLMNDVLNSNKMVELFAVQSHHFNISVLFTVQNFFAGSKYGKTIMRNVNYRVFFYNRLDLVELRNISTQLMPGYANFLKSSFDFLITRFPSERPYLIIDGHVKSLFPRGMYIRSHIFPDNDNIIRPILFSPNPNYNK